MLERVLSEFGLEWAPHKQRGPTACIEFLGLLICNLEGKRCIALTEKRQGKLRSMIDAWLARRPRRLAVCEYQHRPLPHLLLSIPLLLIFQVHSLQHSEDCIHLRVADLPRVRQPPALERISYCFPRLLSVRANAPLAVFCQPLLLPVYTPEDAKGLRPSTPSSLLAAASSSSRVSPAFPPSVAAAKRNPTLAWMFNAVLAIASFTSFASFTSLASPRLGAHLHLPARPRHHRANCERNKDYFGSHNNKPTPNTLELYGFVRASASLPSECRCRVAALGSRNLLHGLRTA